jgi:hypothetical protein
MSWRVGARRERHGLVHIGEPGEFGRNELLALDLGHRPQDTAIRHIAWPDLALDHIEPLLCGRGHRNILASCLRHLAEHRAAVNGADTIPARMAS